ncbi:MAG: hydrogenase expression/formation protein HypE [Nitrososphaerota archaeon]|nr:hydrogenase expression/formation protein HypE [Candidatus Bathyarchaeota archaeon]MDW8049423.1 hydrogenase expression/formation protein HypE [Nitrososphaerota archaeon]
MLAVSRSEHVTMLHGAGGLVMHDLIKDRIIKHFSGASRMLSTDVPLEALDDAAVIEDLVLKSDTHVVKPIFFPGGDIGRLAVSGTVNDIAVMGGQPKALACGLILEEGLRMDELDKILTSMRETCLEAGTAIITGDLKVVEKGSLGGCIINVSGIGFRSEYLDINLSVVRRFRKNFSRRWILDSNISPGDKIIISGTIADHGLAVLSAQEELKFGGDIRSDVKPLNHLIDRLLGEVGGVVAMKDPTRGGLADALNEFAEKSNVGIMIEESKIPIRRDVQVACEMLGLDPLEIGNEGKIVIGIVPEKAEEALDLLRSTEEGKYAEIIGEATAEFRGVAMRTVVGGKRIVLRPMGDPIPRIC